MDCHTAVECLRKHKAFLTAEFGVKSLALFGSIARGTNSPDSDVDVLVSFTGQATSSRYFGVKFFLKDVFGTSVDLVSEKALRPEIRPYVERDAVQFDAGAERNRA